MIKTNATILEIHHSPSQEVIFVLVRPKETFQFLEGQFMMLQADCFGTTIKKPYSIATTNKQLQEYKQVGFYIKKASDQGLSAWLTTSAKAGDEVSLQGPVGHYVDSKENSQYLFISTGSGLSPNLSLFQCLVYEGQPFSKIVHLFGEKGTANLVQSAMSLLEAHGDERITTYTTLSDKQDDNYLSGRVQKHLDDALSNFSSLHISVFLCGAPAMVKEVQQILIDKGIAKENITTEKR